MILLKAIKNTYEVKDCLKENGFIWNNKDGYWEKIFKGRREYYLFMAHFLDDSVYNIDIHEKVVFKAFDVDEEDIKPDHQKELDALKKILLSVKEVKSVEEIKEDGKLGLKVDAALSRVFWYEDVQIKKLTEEIESYQFMLKELKKTHADNVKTNNSRLLDEERWIEFFCIPLYTFLINRKKKLNKRQRKYYENEVETITKHVPKKIKPVDSNEIAILKSE